MKKISLEQIKKRIDSLRFKESFDLIVGIAEGGIVPAYIISRHLKKPLEFIWLRMRDENHKKIKDLPVLVKPISFELNDKLILLVDDRANSGLTLKTAVKHLKGARKVKTLAVSGEADYSLFRGECFEFPWNMNR